MGFFKYPYTDLNELNLDWVIEKIKYIEQASHIIYDNTGSGLTAENVQTAIDEIVGIIQTTGVTTWNTRVGDVVPEAGDYTAAQVTYDGSGSGLSATDVQGAIDEVKGDIPTTAADVPYNNSISGLSATDVQDAIDEISSSAGVSSFNTRTGAVVAASGDYNAGQVTYDNTVSGLTATDTQAAIDELAAAPGGVSSFNSRTGAVVPAASDYDAAQVDFDDTVAQTGSSNVQGALQYVATRGASAQYTTYDNTQSGLTATNVQDAIDEVANDVLSSGVASFNGRTGAVNPAVGDYDLTDLGDVNISTPANDDVLKYDSVTQKWVNGAGGGGGSSTLAGLSDVTLTSPVSGDQLTYDGADWVNTAAPSIPADLDDLTDVTITTPVAGQVLKYDGAGWINAAESGGGADLSKVIADVEVSSTASRAYEQGELFIDNGGYLGRITTAVSLGTTLVLNSNYIRIKESEFLRCGELYRATHDGTKTYRQVLNDVATFLGTLDVSVKRRCSLLMNKQVYRNSYLYGSSNDFVSVIFSSSGVSFGELSPSGTSNYRLKAEDGTFSTLSSTTAAYDISVVINY